MKNWQWRLFLTMLVFMFSIVIINCGSLAGDDDDDDDDDDTGGSDMSCSEAIGVAYGCDLYLTDSDGFPMSLSDAVASCEAGDAMAVCGQSCAEQFSNCDDINDCAMYNC